MPTSTHRACEYGPCRVDRLPEQMIRFPSGGWYCPEHALLLAARDLVALYRMEGDADWAAISEVIAEGLPDILTKLEARELQQSLERRNVSANRDRSHPQPSEEGSPS